MGADGVSTRLADLLRHGQTEGGACFRGSRDDPLTAQGWAELRAATAPELSGAAPAWDLVITSPARRCAEFARELGQRLERPVRELPGLRERHFGTWEGCTAAAIPAPELDAFWRDPGGYTPPGAEPFAAFRQRVATAWRGILAAPAQRQLVLTHGGVLRVILGEVLGMADASLLLLEVPHACRSRVRLPDGAGLPSLVAHGCDGGPPRADR
ncbi:MAG: histidine phosphatase family protein [Thiohalocapsa sp.]|jgi:broad specificity phosphatase PhoE|uniref:histidine phosphatase family protein n=1 Tax=Thiohalocapsa sp. TaxID=2497641 RepID=UPI0025E29A49|nr:histidine phosphatase family protein [Thiohalocapsa sp.]MCG6940367.1 histidine phosphatase family protein [Thiohalocapsa sp.]